VLHILIEESEYIVLPSWNVLVEEVVAVLGSETHCRIYLQKMGLLTAPQLTS
jgi:hypothetical protein